MAHSEPKLHITWPLRDDEASEPFPPDAAQAVSTYAPAQRELQELRTRPPLPDSEPAPAVPAAPETLRTALLGSLPPSAPEWMQAARALSQALEEMIARGQIDSVEQAAIARSWAAWSLGGVTSSHVLRVAHLVSRAHSAIQSVRVTGAVLEAAYRDCAGVLHAGLPTVIRNRMPFRRIDPIVRRLREVVDPWAAVVEATSELLGWSDYARFHAAAVIRAVIEQNH